MKYTQALGKMPLSLKQHFEKQEWMRSFMTYAGVYAELLASKEAMSNLHHMLSKRERQILQLIVKQLGCAMFTIELLEKHAASSLSGAEVRFALLGLRKYGIIVTFRKSWGEFIYILPEEGFSIWQALLFEQPKSQSADQRPNLESIDCESSSRGIAQELFSLINFAAQHDIHLTSKGTLHKRQQQKLMAWLRMPNIVWHQTSIGNLSSDAFEFPWGLLFDFAMRLGLLQRDADLLKLEPSAWSRWLRLTFDQQQAVLYLLWKELHIEPPLWLQHGIAVIDNLSRESWYSLKEIISWFEHHEIPPAPLTNRELSEHLIKQWIEPLQAFRWLEWGKDNDGVIWIHWLINARMLQQAEESNGQEESGQFYVQPEFELLLPPTVAPHIEWEVALFADFDRSDEIRVYRITRESFHRALNSGKSVEAMIQFLSSHAIYKVPPGIEQTLKEWGEQFGTLQFAEVTLLRVSRLDIAKLIRESDFCRPCIESQLGDADFIVKKEQAAEFHKRLEQMGYYPQLSSHSKENFASISKRPLDQDLPTWIADQSKGWFDLNDSSLRYEFAPMLGDTEELYPNLQDIPPRWLKEFGDYHGSTRKDMIRKAIEWKSCLKLRIEGMERDILPQKLQENRSGWILVGMENAQEVTLRSEDWKEMKLILPGINDH